MHQKKTKKLTIYIYKKRNRSGNLLHTSDFSTAYTVLNSAQCSVSINYMSKKNLQSVLFVHCKQIVVSKGFV